MANNVLFKQGTQEKYDALAEKNPNALYWLTDTQRLYRGDTLYGTGKAASATVDGLLSAEDKRKLDALVNVSISEESGNQLGEKVDGLYVPAPPEYTVEKQPGQNTYRLKRSVDGADEYIGDEINIPTDLVIQSGSLEVVEMPDIPYEGAVIGDRYLDLVLNDPNADHIYIPLDGLIGDYIAGDGIAITDGSIAVSISDEAANGLKFADGKLALDLATQDTAGAMSATDKRYLDGLGALLDEKVCGLVEDTSGTSSLTNTANGAGMTFAHIDRTLSFIGTKDGGAGGVNGLFYAIDGDTGVGTRLVMTRDGLYYTKGVSGAAYSEQDELVTRRDLDDIEAGTIYWNTME